MLKFTGITVEGEVGQVRANGEMLAWRGSYSQTTLSVAMQAVKESGWCNGMLRLLYSDPSTGEDTILSLDGFEPNNFETLNQHLEHNAFVSIVVHTAKEPDLQVAANLAAAPLPNSQNSTVKMNDEDIRRIACGERLEENAEIVRPKFSANSARDFACPEVLPPKWKPSSQPSSQCEDPAPSTPEPELSTPEPELSTPPGEPEQEPCSTPPKAENPAPAKPSRGIMVKRYIGRSGDSSEDEDACNIMCQKAKPDSEAADPRFRPSYGPSTHDLNQYQTYSDSLLEGWVWKQSRWVKRWRRRYVVLTSKGLASYKKRGDVAPSAMFDDVSSCSVATVEKGTKAHGFCFCVATKKGNHLFMADDDAARQVWMDKINTSVRARNEIH